jgi:hypothetical protein
MLALSLEEMQAIRRYYEDPAVPLNAGAHGYCSGRPTSNWRLWRRPGPSTASINFHAHITYADEQGHIQDTIAFSRRSSYIEEISQRVDWLMSVFHDTRVIVSTRTERLDEGGDAQHLGPRPLRRAPTGIVG